MNAIHFSITKHLLQGGLFPSFPFFVFQFTVLVSTDNCTRRRICCNTKQLELILNVYTYIYTHGLLGASDKEPACQFKICEKHRFYPWVEKIPWRRKWQPIPVILPGESHGQRSLTGYSPWGCKESGMTEQLSLTQSVYSLSKEWRHLETFRYRLLSDHLAKF